jgi:hypothetical protein
MRRISRSFAVLILLPILVLAILPTSAGAAIYTYEFDSGTVVDFNDPSRPALSTITGTFTVDTTSDLVTSSTVTLSAPAADAGLYNAGGSIEDAFPGFVQFLASTGPFRLSLGFDGGPFGTAHLTLGPGGAVEEHTDIVNGAQSGELTTGGITLLAAVPEPSTWAMLILGFAGIGAMTYRRRRIAAIAA